MSFSAVEWADSFSEDAAVQLLRETMATEVPGSSRAALEAANANIKERFLAGEPVVTLVHLRAKVIDELLLQLWRRHAGEHADKVALVAVGGYGRAELHPSSDSPRPARGGSPLSLPRSGTSASRSVTACVRSRSAANRRAPT